MTPQELADKRRRLLDGTDSGAGATPLFSGTGASADAVVAPTYRRPDPSQVQPSTGRALFDVGAKVNDAALATLKGPADLVNRAAVGVRNVFREGVGKAPVQPMEFNYNATQQRLDAARASNAAPDTARAPVPAVASNRARQPTGQRPIAHVPGSAPALDTSTFVNSAGETRPAVPGVTTTKDAKGNNVYTATGDSVAAALKARGGVDPGSVNAQAFGGNQSNDAGAYPAPLYTRPDIEAPSTNLAGNTYAADKERLQRINEIDAQIAALGPLNMNSKRELAGQLIALKAGLSKEAYSQQNDLTKTGATLNQGGAEAALGANANAAEGAANRGAEFAQQAAQRRAQAQQIGQVLTGADGNVSVLRNDGTLEPLNGADGKPFKAAATRAEGAVTPAAVLDSLTKRLSSLDDLTDKDGSQRAALEQQIQSLYTGGSQAAAATAPEVGTVKAGYRFKGGNPADRANWEKVQ